MNVLASIGNTPLVELRRLPAQGGARVLVKCEGGNPAGSMKDRMALAMVEEGIFAGTSSGLNVLAALRLAASLPPSAMVVTIAVDTRLKYLAGELYRS